MSMMHTYTLLAILLFLLVSYNPISVEARNLVSSKDGVFKASLIHRNSPQSPHYNPSLTLKERLKRSPLGSISRGHNIHLSSSYYGTTLKNYANNSNLFDLSPSDGEYLLKITLGTPKVEFIALVDTGSDLIWLQCTPCRSCIQQKSPLFDPTKSSTYQMIPCTSPACNKSDILSGCPFNNNNNNANTSSSCIYVVDYGDDTQSIGFLGKETITLPSSSSDTTTSMTMLSLPSGIFGCGYNQSGSINGGDGIIGLGTGPSSLISQLGPTINYKFSYCLTPLSSSVPSKLAFGADVTTTTSGVASSTPFTTGGGSHHYNLALDGISIGVNNNTPVQVQVPSDMKIIIDSGTTLTYLPANVYSSLRSALASAIEQSTVPSPQVPYDLCYSGGQFNPPDVVFHFKGHADVVLKAINTFSDMGNDISCLAMVATNETTIFGNVAQVNFHVGYDLATNHVSFVPTDCTKF